MPPGRLFSRIRRARLWVTLYPLCMSVSVWKHYKIQSDGRQDSPADLKSYWKAQSAALLFPASLSLPEICSCTSLTLTEVLIWLHRELIGLTTVAKIYSPCPPPFITFLSPFVLLWFTQGSPELQSGSIRNRGRGKWDYAFQWQWTVWSATPLLSSCTVISTIFNSWEPANRICP